LEVGGSRLDVRGWIQDQYSLWELVTDDIRLAIGNWICPTIIFNSNSSRFNRTVAQ